MLVPRFTRPRKPCSCCALVAIAIGSVGDGIYHVDAWGGVKNVGGMADLMAGDRKGERYASLAEAHQKSIELANELFASKQKPPKADGEPDAEVSFAGAMGGGGIELSPDAQRTLSFAFVAVMFLVPLRIMLDRELRQRIFASRYVCKDEKDEPGDYVIKTTAYVTKSLLPNTEDMIAELRPGTVVRVSEVVLLPEQHRARGRIEEPAGYISLRNTKDGFRWASVSVASQRDGKPEGDKKMCALEEVEGVASDVVANAEWDENKKWK